MSNRFTKTCPDCNAVLESNERFPIWCEQCNWNLDGERIEAPETLFTKAVEKFSKRNGYQLFNSLVNANPEELRPRLSFSIFLAYVGATVVYIFPLILFGLGLWVLSLTPSKFLAFPIGVIILMLGWAMRPRINKVPIDVLPEEEFSETYKLVENIAKKLDTQNVDGIVFNEEFGTHIGNYGFRNLNIITIGLPLWRILNYEERVALISHEISHKINGDIARGLYLGTAINSIVQLHDILVPDGVGDSDDTIELLVKIPLNVLLRVLTYLLRLFIYVLLSIYYSNSQKAEYLADFYATTVCGTEAMVKLLEKTEIGLPRFISVVSFYSLKHHKFDLFKLLKSDFDSVTDHEKERVNRLSKMQRSCIDEAHPPTHFRKKFLLSQLNQSGDFETIQESEESVDGEISKIESIIQSKVIDSYRLGLYY